MIEIKHLVKDLLRKSGFDLIKYNYNSHPLARRMFFINQFGIDTVLDVGANVGQYGKILRRAGYTGKIISFEPLSDAFEKLKKNSKNDKKWDINNYALGNANETLEINVAMNSQSSSFLGMMKAHLDAAPESKYFKKESIKVKTLNSLMDQLVKNEDRVLLKIDTQGFEKKVIEGAGKSIDKIIGVQLELSLVPLYEGELTIEKMIIYMQELGFTLMSIEPGYAHPVTGQLLQVDGLFFRESQLLKKSHA